MLRHALTLLVAASMSVGFAGACEPPDLGDVEGPFVWGGVRNVTRLGNLWFAGQPDLAGLEAARDHGVAVVINMRESGEVRWDEAGAVEALGMRYFSVPVSPWRPFSRQAFDRIAEILESNSGQQILLHCGNSNRVGGWLATHLVGEHGMSVDAALVVGRRAGISTEAIEENVRRFVAEPGDESAD